MSDTTFEKLWQEALPPLKNLAMRLTRHRTDAEDLLGDTSFRCFRGFSGYDIERQQFAAWAKTTMMRIHLDNIRRKNRRPLEAPLAHIADDSDTFIEFEDPNAVPPPDLYGTPMADALQKILKPEDWEILRLARVEELDYCEIAEILGIPIGTVRSRLHRIREKVNPHKPALQILISRTQ